PHLSTPSLHDALPISTKSVIKPRTGPASMAERTRHGAWHSASRRACHSTRQLPPRSRQKSGLIVSPCTAIVTATPPPGGSSSSEDRKSTRLNSSHVKI